MDLGIRGKKKKKIPCIWLILKEELPDFSAESLSTSSRPLGNALSPASPYQPSQVHLVPRAFVVGWPQATQFSCPLCFRHPVAHLPLVGLQRLLDQQIFQTPAFSPFPSNPRVHTPLQRRAFLGPASACPEGYPESLHQGPEGWASTAHVFSAPPAQQVRPDRSPSYLACLRGHEQGPQLS